LRGIWRDADLGGQAAVSRFAALLSTALYQELIALEPRFTVVADGERLRPYETDAFISHRAVPLMAALPETEAQVSAILSICTAHGVPVVTRGAGTGISGGAIPDESGVLLVMTKMKRIVALDPVARQAVVEPGVRNLAVSEAAGQHGLFYAPDPSSQIICSIGGNVAENAGGVHCLKYGLTVHNVQHVRLVTSDGAIHDIGARALDAPGYDLLALVVGSEGTLGVVTEATLKLVPEPEHVETLLAAFSSVGDAAKAVGSIIGEGVIPAALEMMDKLVIEACEKFMGLGFPLDAEALLLVELDGGVGDVADDLLRVDGVLKACGAREIRRAASDEERALLWRARKGAFAALATIRPDYYTIDGTIPRRCLPDVLTRYAGLSEEYGLMVANVFHAGDGNLHPVIFYDANVAGEMERAEEMGGKLLEICIEVGGTITGEHGVGIEKLKQMCVQFRPAELDVFHAIRSAFDPAGVLNPGKAIPSLKRCAEWGGTHVREGKLPFADIPRF
jgi:glycolate oxidase